MLFSSTVFRPSLTRPEAGRKTIRFLDRDRRALQRAGQHLVCWPSVACGSLAPYLSVLLRVLRGRQVAGARVRSRAVVAPPLDLGPRTREREKDLLVEALFTQPAVEVSMKGSATASSCIRRSTEHGPSAWICFGGCVRAAFVPSLLRGRDGSERSPGQTVLALGSRAKS